MKRLSDSLLTLAEARAMRISARADIIELEVEEIDLAIAVRSPSPEEYAAYVPYQVGPMRATARYNLIASCLAYPCDGSAEPDLDALAVALDEVPALSADLVDQITGLATADPHEVIDINEANMPRIKAGGVGIAAEPFLSAKKRAKAVLLPAGAPVRGFVYRKPSRIAWDDYSDGSGLAMLCEKAYNLANDCIVGISEEQRIALLKWAPGLAIAMAAHAADLVGAHRSGDRKKVRRGSSASSAPTPNTPGSA